MIVEIRRTITGTEYWNTKAKKTLFVPKGKKPNFEVTENPNSMIGKYEDYSNTLVVPDPNELTTDELITYAENSGIKIPGNLRKEETIRKYILEELAAAADASDEK